MSRRILSLLALVSLLAAGSTVSASGTEPALTKSVILENNVEYLRFSQVAEGFKTELDNAEKALASSTTNKITGMILDLRFAGGEDYAAAQSAALILAGQKLPLAILVNGRTRGSAVSLAAALQKAGTGLVYGSMTGLATHAGQTIPAVSPDIGVTVSLDDERSFLKNPYLTLTQTATNSSPATNNFSPFIDHTSEADLVRAKIKDGEEDESTPVTATAEPPSPFIHDPALARAVDFLKGLAALHPVRS